MGAAHVSRANPDGYTLLLATNTTLVSSPFLHDSLGFDPDNFAPVGMIGYTPMVLLTAKQNGFSSVEELVLAAKENAGAPSDARAFRGFPCICVFMCA